MDVLAMDKKAKPKPKGQETITAQKQTTPKLQTGPRMQVIVVGAGGGPFEDGATSMLVRSTSKDWTTNCLLAVDAGCHLAAMARIIEEHTTSDSKRPITLKSGPFQGLSLPHINKNANALHITKELVQTFVITHPHLDHTSGFIFATAGMDFKRQKKLAALPSTIQAFRQFIFNGIVWPNLSDQHGGVKLVSYYELTDGGEPTIEDGGYVTLAEGLDVMAMRITHGNCRLQHFSHTMQGDAEKRPSRSYSISTAISTTGVPRDLKTETPPGGGYKTEFNTERTFSAQDDECPVDSTAVFIRDVASKQEIIIFGDVEPDTISIRPLNKYVWEKAAPKIVAGRLKAIFIESSFTDAKEDDYLFGHLTPKYIFQEMKSLAAMVQALGGPPNNPKKRRRLVGGKSTSSLYDGPLSGIKVVIIHVKDQVFDGPDPRVTIREELKGHEERERLGAQFFVSESGDSFYI
ncbi:hypothetical protein HYFRA_00006465 [Hymenoscyphus fraxineus]|uniref:3',5'-cyclic-nucleotide phosphodiesterase n=1 Tax=Hymenoscyphus fraxineus TaxID=746836 RepID=A0A9N9PR26_9HELO|nr:hypothetical protein HYFRA_00006465 [Hymenoscyphus fraxineus]